MGEGRGADRILLQHQAPEQAGPAAPLSSPLGDAMVQEGAEKETTPDTSCHPACKRMKREE